ncbi:alpha,alpha-trehalose-phosphate synthase (UDP-forming) [Coralloluteibacterium stylophorae]|uniref:Trehalose-6-phosphate synthase n=1 Tax=Coralloluteibacterium stylophorae TaxID=1776034 RepID=A0A8J8AYD9_9GAMM|nr:alpha,alpha-trehalose-phosphate synthase (UDP-forming) [Coralloluteibacterium stylophorae]MBS7456814.1 alpha,alpha-trehalose-phosphate synthase (UDP-forming) [Coralloluteibacterium stylophorae]
MGRLVVVSNRVALPSESRPGGLAVALLAALREQGGLWFGWSGKRAMGESGQVHEQSDGNIRYLTVDLSRADYDAYYTGFANGTLWPLLHFRLDLVDYSRETWAGYRRVNELFAKLLMEEIEPDDTVWIHDYHLIPLARFMRARGARCKIGFFLHVPMPSSDLMAALPEHAELFEALACYDLVGFQTHRDLERFQDYVRLFGGGRVVSPGVLETENGNRFRAGAFPISIETERLAEQAREAVHKPALARLHASLHRSKLAIGVDRLDYSKGLPDRFRAFERYLERHPEQRGSLTFLQIAPPSRGDVAEYQALRRELDGLSGHINGAHAEPDWTPVRYVNRNFPHSVLMGFYRLAQVALVTPLRDGMNLVAKEFIAAQDPDDPGVLILSRFAGAASEMREALLVNPYDLDGVADAIAAAASMPLDERQERWDAMMRTLRRYDITHWRKSFLAALAKA